MFGAHFTRLQVVTLNQISVALDSTTKAHTFRFRCLHGIQALRSRLRFTGGWSDEGEPTLTGVGAGSVSVG